MKKSCFSSLINLLYFSLPPQLYMTTLTGQFIVIYSSSPAVVVVLQRGKLEWCMTSHATVGKTVLAKQQEPWTRDWMNITDRQHQLSVNTRSKPVSTSIHWGEVKVFNHVSALCNMLLCSFTAVNLVKSSHIHAYSCRFIQRGTI